MDTQGNSSNITYVITENEGVQEINLEGSSGKLQNIDITNVLPDNIATSDVKQYIKITSKGVFVDKTGNQNFSDANLIATFNSTTAIDQSNINLILANSLISAANVYSDSVIADNNLEADKNIDAKDEATEELKDDSNLVDLSRKESTESINNIEYDNLTLYEQELNKLLSEQDNAKFLTNEEQYKFINELEAIDKLQSDFAEAQVKTNKAPVVDQGITNQTIAEEANLAFRIPQNAFKDIDGDKLTFTATLVDGSALPAWLSFNPETKVFSGLPDDAEIGITPVKVIATDGEYLVDTTFDLKVTAVNDVPTSISLSANTINENDSGAMVGQLKTADVDVGDSHTYTVSDDRFEVVGDKLKLKDDISLDHETEATVDVTVTTTDSAGATHSQLFNVVVSDVNETPEVDQGIVNQTTAEEALLSYTVPDNAFKDVDGDNLTFTATLADGSVLPVWLSFDAATKTFSGLPDDAEIGIINIKVTVSDGEFTADTSFPLEVTAVNDIPTAINLSANTIAENAAGAVVGNLTTVDVDAGDSHTYTVSDNRFEVVANQLKLKDGISLDHETAASVDVTVTTTDTAGATHSQLFNVVVSDVNETPEVDQGIVNQTTAEEATLSYTVPDNAFKDVDGDNLTFTATLADGSALPAWLRFDAATKTFSGLPDDAEIGIINIKVTVSDGEFTADTSFPLEVTAVNDVPTAINLSANTIAENAAGAVVGNLTTVDVDAGDSHTYTVSDNRFEVVANQLKLKDGISLDHETAASVDVTVTTTDTAGATHSQLFNVVVGDVNEAPEVDQGIANQTIAEEATLSYTVPDNAFKDVDGDNLTFTATLADGSALPAWLSFDAATQTFSGLPDDAEIGIINIKVTVSDGEFTADASFPLEVTAVNDVPTAINLSANTIAENAAGAVVGHLTTVDVDAGDSHTYTVSDNRFEVVANQLKLKDGISLDHETAASVDVTVTTTDTAGATHSQLFNVVVSDVNEAPELLDTPIIASVVAAYSFDGNAATDNSGNSNSVTLNGSATYGVDHTGTGTAFTMDGTDGSGKIDGVTTGGAMSVSTWVKYDSFEQNWSRVFDFGDEQADNVIMLAHNGTGSTLAFEVINNAGTGETAKLHVPNFFTVGEWVHVTATIDDTGLMSIYKNGELAGSLQGVVPEETVRNNNYIGDSNWVNDGHFEGSIDNFIIYDRAVTAEEVQNIYATDTVNELLQNNLFIDENTADDSVVGSVVASDIENNDLEYSLTNDAGGRFAIDSTTGEITVTDASLLDYETATSHVITVQAFDGELIDTKSYTIKLRDINEAPEVDQGIANQTIAEESTLSYTVPDNAFKDVEGDDLTFTATLADGSALPAWLSFDAATKTFSGLPDDAEIGIINIKVTVSDGEFTADTSFPLEVTAVNDVPTAINLSANTIAENATGAIVGNLTTDDVDAEEIHTYAVSDNRFEVVGGQLKLKDGISLDHETVASVDVTVTTTDTAGATHSQLFNVVVSDVNEAPTVTETAVIQGTEDTTLIITNEQLLVNASDVEGDDLSVVNASYSGSDGSLTSVNSMRFGTDTDNKIELVDKLQSIDAFSLEFDYTSTGAHESIDSIFAASTTNKDNALTVIANPDGEILFYINGDLATFSGVNLYDGLSHNIVLTWDNTSGELKFFDNNQLIETKTHAQGEVIADNGWVILGQEQDTYGGGFDATQALTNAELGQVTLAYDVVSQADIEAGTSVADASNNLALDLVVEGGQIVDRANDSAITTAGSIDAGYHQFTPNANFNGNLTIDYEVSDGTNATATQATLELAAVNDAPEVDQGIVNQTTAEEALLSYTVPDNAFKDVDGDNLTFTATLADGSALPGWLSFDAATKTFSGLPDDAEIGIINIKVTASDGEFTADTSFPLEITAVNDVPTAINLSANTIAENAAGAIVGNLTTVDVDAGDSHTYIVSDNRFEVVANQLKLKDGISLDHETVASVDVTVTTTDTAGATHSQLFNVVVGDVNEAPEVDQGIANQTIAEEASLSYTVPDNAFKDVDGDNLTFTATLADGSALPVWLSFDAATKTFSGLPDDAEIGIINIKVTVSDGEFTADASFPLEVTAINDVPAAINLSANTIAENAAGAIVGNLTTDDVDAEEIHTYAVSDNRFEVVGGQLKLKDGISLDHETAASVDVTVTTTDTAGATHSQLFNVVVSDVNEAPELLDTPIIASVVAAYSFDSNAATDNSGNSNSVTLNGSATYGVDHTGTSTAFTMDGTDGSGKFDGVTTGGAMSISTWVKYDSFEQNWSRVFDFGDGQADNIILLAHAGTGSTLAFEVLNNGGTGETAKLHVPNFFTVGEWVHVTATIDDTGLMSIYKNGELAGSAQGVVPEETVRNNNYIGDSNWATDGHFEGSIDNFIIYDRAVTAEEVQNIYALDTANELLQNNLFIAENTADNSVVGSVVASDIENNDLEYSLTNDAGGRFAIDSTTGEITVTDASLLDYEAATSHVITVQAFDGELIDTKSYTIKLRDINEAPEVDQGIANQTIAEETTLSYTVPDNAFSDVEGDDLTFTATLADGSALPAWLSFDATTKTFSGLPDDAEIGIINIKVTVSDSEFTADASFPLEVTAVNDVPTAINLSANTIAENAAGAVVGHLTTVDVDAGDSHTYTVSDNRFEVVANQLKLKDGISLDHETVASVDVTVTTTDTAGATHSQLFNVVVGDVNEAPEVDQGIANQTIAEEATLSYTVPDNAFKDVEGDDLTFTATLADGSALPAWLSFDAATKTFSGLPDDAEVGVISVKVTASDGELTADVSFNLEVTAVNDFPTAINLSANTIAENAAGAIVGNLTTGDVDAGEIHTYTVSDNRFEVVGGQLKLKDGISLDHETVASVDVTITTTDIAGATHSQLFNVVVSDVNEAPTVTETAVIQGTEDTTLIITNEQLLVNASDIEGDDLSVVNASYSGSDGALTSVNSIRFGTDTDNKIELVDKLQSIDAFSLEFDYTSTGAHESIDSIFATSTTNKDNALTVIANPDGEILFYINGDLATFSGVNLYDGLSHNIVLTWDNTSGELKFFDNNQLIETKTHAQGEVIADNGWVILGQEQDTYGGGFDATQALTNAELGQVTLAYDVVSQADIEAGTSVADASNNLALDLVVEGGQIVDRANDSAITTAGSIDAGYHQFTPNANFNGNLTIDYEVSDGTNATATQATLELAAVNDAPEVDQGIANQTIAEEAILSYTVPDNAFSDVEGDNLTFTATLADGSALPAWLSFDAATKTFSGTPDDAEVGVISVKVTASDGELTADTSFSLEVTDVNNVPTAINLSANIIAENAAGAIVGDLTTDDVDTGETHTYTVSDDRFEVVANQLKLKDGISLDHETVASVDITVTTTDTAGATHSQLFNVVVGDVNEAPEVDQGIANQTIAEEATLSYTVPDNAFSDVEGDNLTFTATLADGSALPAWLSFDVATKTFSGLPDDAEVGVISVKVTASDGELTADVSFNLEVTAVNDFPTAINLSANTIAENAAGAIVGNLTTGDVDAGEIHTYTVSDNRFEVVGGQLKLKDGISLDHETVASVDVTITTTDIAGATHSQLFNVVVSDVNEAPTVTETAVIQGTEDTTLIITNEQLLVNASDIEGDDLSVVNASYSGSDGALTSVNSIRFGTDTDNKIELVDKLQSIDAFSLEFDYTSTGAHESIDSIFATSTTNKDNALTVIANPDGEILFYINGDLATFSGVNLYDGLSHNIVLTWDNTSGELKFFDNNQLIETKTHAQGEVIADNGWVILGQEQDTYGGGFDATQALTNAELGQVTLAYDVVSQADIEAGTSVADASNNLALDLVVEGGQIVDRANDSAITTAGSIDAGYHQFTPNANFNGNLTIDYEVSDGTNATATQATLELAAVNDAPEVDQGIANQTIAEEAILSYTVPDNAFSDVEGDNLTFTATLADGSALPAWLSFDAATKTFSGTPDDAEVGVISVKVTASDGELTADTSFSLEVTDVNNVPTAINLSANIIAENAAGAIVGDLTTDDVDTGETHTYTVSDDRFEVVANQLKLKDGISLDHETVASVDITVTTTDTAGATHSQLFNVVVGDVNEAPEVDQGIANQTIAEEASLSYTVPDNAFSDVEGDNLTFTAILADGSALPAWLSFDAATKTFSGTPDDAEVGVISVKVTASDGELTADVSFNLEVTAVNDFPTAINLSANTIAENAAGAIVGNLTTDDVDAGENHTYIVSDDRFEVVANQLKLKDGISLDHETVASVDVTVTTTDTAGATHSQLFNVVVSDINEAPELLDTPIVASVVAAYSFDSNVATDNSGNSNSVTLNGSATYGVDHTGTGTAFTMDGTDGSGKIDGVTTGGAMSVSTWVKYDSFEQNWSRVFDFGDEQSDNVIMLAHNGTGSTLAFEVINNGGTGETAKLHVPNFFTVGEWVHVTATIDDTGLMSIYKNGELAGSLQGVVPEETVRNNNYIGDSNWANDGHFEGSIDNFIIYDRAVTAEEVQNIYALDTVNELLQNNLFIAENTADDSVVGSVVASDIENNDLEYSLTNDAGGRFAIDSTTGEITVTDASLLDYETATSHVITVQAFDGELIDTKSYTIKLRDINEAPIIATELSMALSEPVQLDLANEANHQDVAQIVQLSDGSYLSAWLEGSTTNTAGVRIKGQKFDASMNPVEGVVTLTQTDLTGDDSIHGFQLKALENGGFVTSYQRFNPGVGANSTYRVFDNDANAVTNETHVNTGFYSSGSVALDDGGYVLLGFQTTGFNDIRLMRYDAAGNHLETVTSTTVTPWKFSDSTAVDMGNGKVASLWRKDVDVVDNIHLFIYDFTTDTVVVETDFGGAVHNFSDSVEIVALSSGDFAVLYNSGDDLLVQKLDESGNLIGGAVKINQADMPSNPFKLVALADGGMAISWSENDLSAPAENQVKLYSQRFDSDVNAIGDKMLVSEDSNPQVTGLVATASGDIKLTFTNAINDVLDVHVHSIGTNLITEVSENGTFVGQVYAADDDNDSLIYGLTDDAGGRFAIDSETGRITVADGTLLDYETATSHTVTVEVSNGEFYDTETYQINVNDVNEAPIVTETAVIQGTEDTTLIITNEQLLVNASDVEGDDLSVVNASYSGSDGALTSVNSMRFGTDTDNKIELVDKLQSIDAFSLEFDYTSTGTHESIDSIFATSTTNKDNALTVIANPDGEILFYINGNLATFSGVNLYDGLSHNIVLTWDNTSGELKFFDNNQLIETKTHAQGEVIADNGWVILGQEQDTYGGGFDATQALTNAELGQVTLAYDVVSQADIEAGTSVADASNNLALDLVVEGGQIVDRANDSAITTAGSIDAGYHQFTPNANFSGNLTIDYEVSDGTNATATQATLELAAVNDAPEVDQGIANQTIAEEAILSYTVPDNAFSDVEGDNLTFTATLADGSALPAWLSFDAATKTFSGLPDDAEVGVISVKVTASDGELTADVSFNLEVTAVNDFPTAINLSANTIAENAAGAVVGNLTTVDVDAGDSHTYTVSDNRFEVVGSQLKLKDGISLDHETVASVDITVTTTDTAGATHSQLFNVVVSDVNDAPTVTETAVIQGTEDTTLRITNEQLLVNASDLEGDNLSVVNASYSGSDGDLTSVNSMSFGTDTDNKIELTDKLQSIDAFSLNINYKSTGSHSGSVDGIFGTSTIDQQNALTVISNSDGEILFYINGNLATFSGVNLYDGLSHDIVLTWDNTNGELKFFDNNQLIETKTHAQGEVIADNGWVILGQEQDSYGGGFDATQVLTNADLAQVTLAYDVVSQADIEAGTSVADASNNLALDLVVEAGQIVDRANDSAITTAGSIDAGYHQFTPNANFNGNLTIDYEVSDGTNATATQATLELAAVNDAPEVDQGIANQTIAEEASLSYTVPDNAFSDVEGDNLTFTATLADGSALPAWLNFDAVTKTFSGTPDDAEVGVISVKVTASDGELTADISFNLEVTAVNDFPTAINLSANTIAENAAGAIVGNLTTDDVDAGDSHTYTVSDNRFEVVGGQLKLKDGISLDHETAASVDITVTSTDTAGAAHSQLFNVVVSDVNDAPTVTETAVIQGTEDTTLRITNEQLLVNASDLEGDNLSVVNASYSGSDGVLTSVNSMSFGTDTDNKIELTDKLQSIDAFSLNIDYTSTGSHSGSIDSIFSVSTSSQQNALTVIAQSNGDLLVHIDDESIIFTGVDMHDGASHNIVLTWDSSTGSLALYDNSQLIETKTTAQGQTIAADGWVILGQEQDSYGGGFDSSQSLTNADLAQVTLAYEAIDQATIEAGTSVADASNNLALDLVVEAGQIVDRANDSAITTAGSIDAGYHQFTPNANFSGNLTIDYEVSDGTNTTATQATLDITAVNDAPELLGTPLVESVVAAYSFDSNAATDNSGNSNSVTLNGSATYGVDHTGAGTAFTMDGTDGSGKIDGVTTGGAMSISTWVKYDSFEQNWSRVFDFGDGQADNIILLAHAGTGSTLAFEVLNNGGTGETAKLHVPNFFTVGEWVHVTATIDDTGLMSIYKNGELAGSAQGIVPEETVRNNNYIGDSNWATDGHFEGSIDNFIIYDRAVTAGEVQNIYALDTANELLQNNLFIAENTADNSVVGSIVANDIENNDLEYSLTNDAGGRFAIDSTTGEITVADGSLLDFETMDSHTITVQASDGDVTSSKDYTIKLNNVDIEGTAADDNLAGTADSDFIQGMAANDTLDGGAGDDVLSGGAGNDILTGGDGGDHFIWQAGDLGTLATPAEDTVTDFQTGANGDVLELEGILQDTDSHSLDEYLSLNFADGNTTIDISPVAGGDVTQKITLQGVDLSGYGGAVTNAEIIDNLLNDGNLDVH